MSAPAKDPAGGGGWVGTVDEFSEIEIVGTTDVSVRARIKHRVKMAIEERQARGEKFPLGKLKVTARITKRK